MVRAGVKNPWLLFFFFFSTSCFKLVFLRKAIMGCILLNISLKLLLTLSMCWCLFLISFLFSSTRMYANLDLQCFKSNDYLGGQLSQFFSYSRSVYLFSTNLFIRSWECFLYSSKVEHMCLILSASL